MSVGVAHFFLRGHFHNGEGKASEQQKPYENWHDVAKVLCSEWLHNATEKYHISILRRELWDDPLERLGLTQMTTNYIYHHVEIDENYVMPQLKLVLLGICHFWTDLQLPMNREKCERSIFSESSDVISLFLLAACWALWSSCFGRGDVNFSKKGRQRTLHGKKLGALNSKKILMRRSAWYQIQIFEFAILRQNPSEVAQANDLVFKITQIFLLSNASTTFNEAGDDITVLKRWWHNIIRI